MRYGLISFAPNAPKLDRFAEHLPLLKTLRVEVGHHFWQTHERSGISYEDWAVASITLAMTRGYDVYIQLIGHADDLSPEHAERIVEVVSRVLDYRITKKVGKRRRGVPRRTREVEPPGKLLGVTFDAEWTHGPYVVGGAAGYVAGVAPLIRALRSAHPDLPIGAPGGTHSDDDTLQRVLSELAAAGAKPSFGTVHVYFDKGWSEADARMAWLRRVFDDYGLADVAITETGVTGQESKAGGFLGIGSGGRVYNDGLRGSADDNFHARFARMKSRYDVDDRWAAAMLYQETEEAEDLGREEHGHGFGIFRNDWSPKSVVEFFR